MATIVVGDIHGHLHALEDLLAQVRAEIDDDVRVVFLGDYIDRGPSTKGCVDAILTFRRQVKAEVVTLLGNHEDWFLRTLHDPTRHSWLLGMEAFETIESYSTQAAATLREAASVTGPRLLMEKVHLPYELFLDAMPASHVTFFEGLLPCYHCDDAVCVHAGLDPRISRLEDQPQQGLLWGTGEFPEKYCGTETVVYGHWNNAEIDSHGWPQPKILGSTIGIDTISHGVLTAVRLPDRRFIQSRRYRV